MLENYFWGEVGVQINAFMSGTAWNLQKMMQKLQGRVFADYFSSVFSTRFLLCCSSKKELIRTD
jgi:IS5 family transposase